MQDHLPSKSSDNYILSITGNRKQSATDNAYLSHLSPTYPGRHASHMKSSPRVVGMHVGLKLEMINKFIAVVLN